VMFEMFTNKLPFEVRGNVEGAAKQQAKWVELHSKGPNWDLLRCSAEAKTVCKMLLTFRESARPSAQECLQNHWLKVPEAEELTQQEMEKLCSAVLTWRDRSACQRAFCLKVAANCTCIDKFAKIFVKFDTDHSGILDTPEMVSALMSVGISKDLAKKTAKALDVNGDNSCEYLEFTAACLLSMEEEFDELLRQEFRILDAKRSGNLSPKEMEPLMMELKALAASRGFTIEEIDADGDGQVDFHEFCSYFGRPNVSYSRALPRKDGPNGLSRMPMKQHVRIMGGQGKSIETSMEAIRKSMPAGKNDAAPIKKGEIEPTGDESIGKKAQSAPELPEAKKMPVQETEKSKKKAAPTTKKSESALPSSAPTSAGEPKRRISSSSSAASSASAAGYAPKASDGKADAVAKPDAAPKGPDKTTKSAGPVHQADLAAGQEGPDADSAAALRTDQAAAVLSDTTPAEPNAAKNVDMASELGSDARSLQGNPESGNIPSPMSQDGTTVRISMSDSSLQEQIPPPCGCLSSSTKSKSPVRSQAPLQQPARPPLKCGRLTISL
ncbi:CPK19, partial [Symbiodinium sp. CCMP2456]